METTLLDVKIHYEQIGDRGPCVLFLHGWGCSIRHFEPIMQAMADGYRLYAIDFPAHGQSGRPPVPWGVDDFARLTEAFIQERGIAPCDIVAHSFGGRVTIMLSAEDNALFDKLIMIDAAGVRPRRTIKYYVKTWAYKLAKKLARIGFIDRVFRMSERQKNAGSADYRALKTDVMRKTFVNVVNQDLTPLLGGIKNDTLLIWGDKDTATPLEYAKLMEKKMPNAGLAVLEGAGHFSYAEKYPQFCAVMKAYLKG